MAIPLKYNLRNLVARKTSTGMTAFVIGLVVAVFLCVLALVQGVTRTLSVNASTRNILAMRVGSQAEMQSVITRDQAEQLQSMPGSRAQRRRQARRLARAHHAHQRPARRREVQLERPGARHGADRVRDAGRASSSSTAGCSLLPRTRRSSRRTCRSGSRA